MTTLTSILPLAVSKMLDYPQLGANSTLLAQITPALPHAPFYYSSSSQLVSWTSDKIIGVAAPTVAYWIVATLFHILDVVKIPYFENRRIHESDEVLARNKATIGEVLKMVVFQHVIQTFLGVWWLEDTEDGVRDVLGEMAELAPKVATGVFVLLGQRTGEQVLKAYGESIVRFVYWWGIPLAQLWFGFFIIDTWQYTLHRLMHTYHFLYRHFHSVHHRLYVPYAFGALYNHPVEGFAQTMYMPDVDSEDSDEDMADEEDDDSSSSSDAESDGSLDLLAAARKADPEAVLRKERQYDAEMAERLAEEIPAGSSAATAGGGSGFASPASGVDKREYRKAKEEARQKQQVSAATPASLKRARTSDSMDVQGQEGSNESSGEDEEEDGN